jgi:uncharacterized protein (DUF433 family)
MTTDTSRITKTADVCGGDARIDGHRIPVWSLVVYRRLGASDERILQAYPSINATDLEAAFAYAAAHPEEIDEAIRENEAGRGGRVADAGQEEQFHRLVREWKAGRGPTSSVTRMAAHPAYRQIIGMGEVAVPLLLDELERQPDHWFLALHELTGADPVPKESRGKLREMAAAWLRWGDENGFGR